MSHKAPTDIAASVRARLKNKADELGLAFDQVLQYYAMERFLYRLSRTRWADVLIVKGAAMLRVWDGAVARPTRDIDFLGRIDSSPESVGAMIRECLGVTVKDGFEFSTDMTVEPIIINGRYPGVRTVVRGRLSGARIMLQLDIGIADTVFPDPSWTDYPTLLGMEAPRILAYQPSTAIAEKFQTMIEKGRLNSRVKDYYDIWMLSHTIKFQGAELRDAIRVTFEQRSTPIPSVRPDVLGKEYTQQPMTRVQWAAFVKKMRESGVEAPEDFEVLTERVNNFIMPIALAATRDEAFDSTWEPTSGWS